MTEKDEQGRDIESEHLASGKFGDTDPLPVGICSVCGAVHIPTGSGLCFACEQPS